MKTRFISKIYFINLLLAFSIILSCGKFEPATESTSEEIAIDSTTSVYDTATIEYSVPDSIGGRSPASVGIDDRLGETEIDPTQIDSKIGKVAFFCENENIEEGEIFEMKEERSYEMIAMLNPIIKNDDIKTEILKVINESRVENSQPPLTIDHITTRNIILGNYLKMQIKDSNDKLIIKLITNDENSHTKKVYDEIANQYIDENFEWKWNVTPKPNSKGKTKLTLVISPLNNNKETMKENVKTYDININFKQSFFASVWQKMNENIEWAIASIIAPVLIFLVGRFTKKREQEKL